MVPAEPVPVADPERELHLRSLVAKFSGGLNRKAMKVRFLAFISPGLNQMSLGAAWRALHPKTEATDKSCYERGSTFYAEILADLGPDPHPADILALCGIHVGSIGQDLARARGAKFRREYYDHKTGKIIQGEERDDFMAILRQVELSMKAIGLGKEKESGDAKITVNVVSYLPGSIEQQKPWPGGGRCAPDGVLRPTVGPDSYEALVARGAIRPALPAGSVTVDLGGAKDRDD